MLPHQYLARVEPVVMAFYEALRQAEIAACAERVYLEPEYEYRRYQFEIAESMDDFDDSRLKYMHGRAAEAHEAILLLDTAAAAAAGAVLQTAKQCITLAWPDETIRLTKGRVIGKTQPLSAVIWYGRNQDQHFDEGFPMHKKTRNCINKLAEEAGLNIDHIGIRPRSLAKDILQIIGWIDYGSYVKGMNELLQLS